MGKKSRLKRERKLETEKGDKLAAAVALGEKGHDEAFKQVIDRLRKTLGRCSPADAILAIAISDLWLPNIGSQVNHQFVLGVAVSMQPGDYDGRQRLDTYDEFSAFIGEVHAALPSWPTLEDYVPELDWGDVHLDVRGKFIPVLYGGNVERVVDFIAAFRLLRGSDLFASSDMDFALLLQNHLITNIHTQPPDQNIDVAPGHLEIPPEPFWTTCKEALLSSASALKREHGALSQGLLLNLGDFKMPRTMEGFGEAVMTGMPLPALMVRVGDIHVPLSPRSAPGLVIDYWSNRNLASVPERLDRLAGSLSEFISDRFDQRDVVAGPMVLSTPHRDLPYIFAAAFPTNNKFCLVVPVASIDPADVKRMCRKIRDVMSSQEEWGFTNTKSGRLMQPRRTDGKPLAAEDIVIFIIPAHVTTAWQMLPSLGDKARLVFLSDFVSVFDSLKDIEEFNDFLAYVDSNDALIMRAFSGLTDLFGSFRDSFGLLVGGAVEPTMISLDPHWGSNWRYKELSTFWKAAPPDFPDDKYTWNIESGHEANLFQMTSKGRPVLSWSTIVGGCAVHVVFPFVPNELDSVNGHLLETFVHCVADALSQRVAMAEKLSLFDRPRIVLVCGPNRSTVVDSQSREVNRDLLEPPLFGSMRIVKRDPQMRITCRVEVNLSRVQNGLIRATNASFEAECTQELLRSLGNVTGDAIDSSVFEHIAETSTRRPRFVLKQFERDVDVPEYVNPSVPKLADYKVARRDLAIVFQRIGAEPGRYELADAKVLIDRARDEYRAEIHRRISEFNREALVKGCIEQHDALTTIYLRTIARVKMSLSHEVSYDRADTLAQAHDNFTKNARNYRYLLEAAFSSTGNMGSVDLSPHMVQLVAAVDWLFVLYGASDVLHNGIDAGGIELDRDYVPEVFYSANIDEQERDFSLESASHKLGAELESSDEIDGLRDVDEALGKLDQAFQKDLQFTFTHLIQALLALARWASASGTDELHLSYTASVEEIVVVLRRAIEDLRDDEAERLIKFLTLDPAKIRHLEGKAVPESDVPVWEHNKRTHRYLIRPLIAHYPGNMVWGAHAAERASRIWFSSVSDGYLPAEFRWPSIKAAVREVKKGIETSLERRAYEVSSRAAPYLEGGVDFMRRFPKDNFEDVGDFDVLAYWPETNRWLIVECKYNQPPFCMKDARRLRDRMFGEGEDRGYFKNIERRSAFLQAHCQRLRELLDWPAPKHDVAFSLVEAYVSRDIYWWMRNPPYEVNVDFVRIDALDGWLRAQNLLGE